MIKAHLFINGCSLKNRCYDEYDLLRSPLRVGLETFYATLLILTREQPFSTINALPNTFLIPTESCSLKSFGYTLYSRLLNSFN
ncbi:MAG: hypothetical protein COB83_04205 [Gammaproteobacteria bacterium]|nr:MAG: hypothetical protein COB83_04205 [Gammaproteobacteria bacterium]